MYSLHAQDTADYRTKGAARQEARLPEARPLEPLDTSREALFSWVDQTAGSLLKRISDSALELDRTGMPVKREDLVEAARCGLMIASLPKKVGGLGLNMQSWGRILERVGFTCDDASFTLLISLFPAVANMILASGNSDLVQRYVVPLCTGSRLVAFAYTEDRDPFSMATTMSPDGDDFVINGSKTIISGGDVADAYMVYLMNEVTKDMAVVIIDRDTPGLTVRPIDAMGLRGSGLAGLTFESVRISKAQILQAYNGLDHVQMFLNPRRAILTCAPVGRMDRIVTECAQILSETVRYGQPLTSMQAVQVRIGKMQMAVHVSRTLVERTLFELDQGTCNPLFDELVSTTKHQVTEHSISVSLDSIHLTGGRGYARAMHFERYLRDLCGMISGAGAQDILEINLGLLAIGRATSHVRK